VDAIENADIVITQVTLTERAKARLPQAHHLSMSNFMDGGFYDQIIEKIKGAA
jgi:PTS system mannitol-specific IIC component